MRSAQTEDTAALTPSMERALGPDTSGQSFPASPFAEIAASAPSARSTRGWAGSPWWPSCGAYCRAKTSSSTVTTLTAPTAGAATNGCAHASCRWPISCSNRAPRPWWWPATPPRPRGLSTCAPGTLCPSSAWCPPSSPPRSPADATIGVLTTKATMRGRLLHDVIERFADPEGVNVITSAPDGLVQAVERGDLHYSRDGQDHQRCHRAHAGAGGRCHRAGLHPFSLPQASDRGARRR